MTTYERKFNGYRAVIVADGPGPYPDADVTWNEYLEQAERTINAGMPSWSWDYMRSIKDTFPVSCNYAYLETPYNAVVFEKTESIVEQLPHGSGIDADWTHETRFLRDGRVKVVFSNSYHAMTENGMYDGWADFSVTVYFTVGGQLIGDKSGKVDFTLSFHGQLAQYLNQKHQIREYLEETIYWSLNEPESEG